MHIGIGTPFETGTGHGGRERFESFGVGEIEAERTGLRETSVVGVQDLLELGELRESL
jgi:hypothetical protein